MENPARLLWLMIIISILILILKFIVEYIVSYIPKATYIKMEMKRAHTRAEYRHWKNELKALRLCFIPYMTMDKAKYYIYKFKK